MTLEHNGIPVFYTDNGEGQALVFLHGFLENSSIWNPFIPELSKTKRVICIDLLGHGKTGCLNEIHTMEVMADTVKTILNNLSIERAFLFGHSMGGYVALALAEKYNTSGICLINSTASADSEEKQLNRERAIAAVKKSKETFVRMAISNLFSPQNRELFSNEIETLKTEALKTPVRGIAAALKGMKIRKDRTALFHSGRYKKMLILGKKDPVLNYNDLLVKTKNTDVEIAVFEDGHMSYIENTRELLHKIMHFIE